MLIWLFCALRAFIVMLYMKLTGFVGVRGRHVALCFSSRAYRRHDSRTKTSQRRLGCLSCQVSWRASCQVYPPTAINDGCSYTSRSRASRLCPVKEHLQSSSAHHSQSHHRANPFMNYHKAAVSRGCTFIANLLFFFVKYGRIRIL